MYSANRDLTRARLVAPLALLVVFLIHSWFGPDVFYHLAWGRDVVALGRLTPARPPLMAQPLAANGYWLFQAALYLIHQIGGLSLGSFVFGLLWLATFWTWARVATLDRWTRLGPWLALLMVLATQSRFEQRPEVVSYLMIAWLVALIARLDLTRAVPTRATLAVASIEALWCNVHGYFALGPLILAARVAATLVDHPALARPILRRGGALVALEFAASVASPFGVRTWAPVAAYAGLGGQIKDLIQELAPPPLAFASPTLAAFWIAVLLTAWRLGLAVRRRDAFASLLGAAGLLLPVHAVRNVPLLFVLGAPLWTTAPADESRAGLRRANSVFVAAVAVLFGAAFVTGAYGNAIGYLGSFGVKLELASYPVAAAEFLRARGFAGRVFNDSYDGGYLEYALPAATVTGDSYFSDAAITREYLRAIREPAGLADLDARFGFDAFLINVENAANFALLAKTPGVRLAHVSPHRALFLRGDGGGAGPPAGRYYAGDDLHHWANAFGPATWIAIARRHGDLPRLLAVLDDLRAAPALPASLLATAVSAPPPDRRCAVANAVRELGPRAFADDTFDPARLAALLATVGPCHE